MMLVSPNERYSPTLLIANSLAQTERSHFILFDHCHILVLNITYVSWILHSKLS